MWLILRTSQAHHGPWQALGKKPVMVESTPGPLISSHPLLSFCADLFRCLSPLPVYLYFQFWSRRLPLCYLAGTIAPMSRSSKYNRSHERAERACEAFQSIISILQVRRTGERDRWRKASCFQPNALSYPSPSYKQVGVLWRQSAGPGGRESCL